MRLFRRKTPPARRPLMLSAEAIRNVERRGAARYGLKDFYHALMTRSLPQVLAGFLALFFVINLLFACLYHLTGGLAGATHGTFADDFFFSVETLSTTGYGATYPDSLAANLIASCEITLGLLTTALATGVIFAHLSRPSARVLFSKIAVVASYRGEPTLMFRVANERRNQIAEARITATITVDEDDGAGGILRRLVPLKLERDTSPIFSLSWLVMHKITPESPIYAKNMEEMEAAGHVLVCSLTGTDDTLNAAIHARHIYGAEDIRFGHRFVDVIERLQDGSVAINYDRFHDAAPE